MREEEKMRTDNVLKNVVATWIGQIVIVVCNLISRAVFIKILPIEYLGLNGLFNNVLILLSFADLGLGLSVSYYLYEPLAKKDDARITYIIRIYKKIYSLLGCVIFVVGVLLIPFLSVILKDCKIFEIKQIYLLHIINTSISYFNVHKVTLLSADQKNYINSMYTNTVKIMQVVLSSIILFITQNYIAYYLVQIVATVVINGLISGYVNKIYPYINDKVDVSHIRKIGHEIKENIGAMVLHKFSSVIVNGTDNILISLYVSIVSVGLYSNYSMIINNISNVLSQFFWSMASGIGNFAASESYKKKTQLFYTLLFLEFWLYGFCSICLFVLLSSFIKIWLGAEFILGQDIIFVLVLNFYMQGMRKIVLAFRDAEGLFRQDSYKAVLEAIINLVVSLYLVQRMGLVGTFIGTVISTVMTCVWLEPLVLFRNGLQGGLKRYYLRYLRYFVEVFCGGIVTYLICNIFEESLFSFVLKMMICSVVPNILFFILHFRDFEFKQLVEKIINVIKRKKKDI